MTHWIAFIFLGTLGWGTSLYFIKILTTSFTPIEIVLYRMIIGTFSLIVIVCLLQIKINNYKNLLKDGMIIGIFNMLIPFYLTSLAIKNVPSSLATIINGLTPLCTFIIASICLPSNIQKYKPLEMISIFAGLTGIIIINYDFHLLNDTYFDTLILFATCISYAIAASYIKYSAAKHHALLLAMIASIFSMLIMILIKIIFENHSWHFTASPKQLFALLWLGAVGSGISIFIYFYLIQKSNPIITSMITYLMIATGVAIGVLFLDETMTPLMLLGSCLIALSLILIHFRSQKIK